MIFLAIRKLKKKAKKQFAHRHVILVKSHSTIISDSYLRMLYSVVLQQVLCMMGEVLIDECGDEIVAVVVALLEPHCRLDFIITSFINTLRVTFTSNECRKNEVNHACSWSDPNEQRASERKLSVRSCSSKNESSVPNKKRGQKHDVS